MGNNYIPVNVGAKVLQIIQITGKGLEQQRL